VDRGKGNPLESKKRGIRGRMESRAVRGNLGGELRSDPGGGGGGGGRGKKREGKERLSDGPGIHKGRGKPGNTGTVSKKGQGGHGGSNAGTRGKGWGKRRRKSLERHLKN